MKKVLKDKVEVDMKNKEACYIEIEMSGMKLFSSNNKSEVCNNIGNLNRTKVFINDDIQLKSK